MWLNFEDTCSKDRFISGLLKSSLTLCTDQISHGSTLLDFADHVDALRSGFQPGFRTPTALAALLYYLHRAKQLMCILVGVLLRVQLLAVHQPWPPSGLSG